MQELMWEFYGTYEDAWVYLENAKKESGCPESCKYELIGRWSVKCQLVKVVDEAMRAGRSALEIVKLVSGKEACDCCTGNIGCCERKKQELFTEDKKIE